MAVRIESQREKDPPFISGPSNRNFIFIEYRHTITAEEEGYFEWWFPFSNGERRNTMVHNASLRLSKSLEKPRRLDFFLQSSDEQVRTFVYGFGYKKNNQAIPFNFVVPAYARGILEFEDVAKGTEIHVAYIIERM
jgi:hypothetical protein